MIKKEKDLLEKIEPKNKSSDVDWLIKVLGKAKM